MIKFMILFERPEDADSFESVYADFLALVERMPNIMRRQVVHVTGSPQGAPSLYRILELYFDSTDAQTEALMSPVGQEAGRELFKRLPKDSFQLLMADVYEETGGSTRHAEPEETPAEAAADSIAVSESAPPSMPD